MNSYHLRRANFHGFWAAAFLCAFTTAAGFTYGNLIDPTCRPFAVLPGVLSAFFLIGLVIEARRAARAYDAHFTRSFIPTNKDNAHTRP